MLRMKQWTLGFVLTSTLALSVPGAMWADENPKAAKPVHHLENSHHQERDQQKSINPPVNSQQTTINEQIFAINEQNPGNVRQEHVRQEVVQTHVKRPGHVHNIIDILDEGNALPLQDEPYTTSSYYYKTEPVHKGGYYYGQGVHYTRDHLAKSFHHWQSKWHLGHHGFHHFNQHHWAHHTDQHAQRHDEHHGEHHGGHHGGGHHGGGHHGGHHSGGHHGGHHGGGHHGGGHHR